jgi:hypothetical protein
MAEAKPYPLTLTGTLDEPLSRGLWLVKWLLAIPHYIVLWFLFIAAFFCWLISLFAILFTGQYPRSLFDFNVGVMRWTWRVSYYSYSALATDKYPPFSLEAGGYPADLSVEYPAKLSQGLVLVKWWLPAIPQLIIVAIFQGGGKSPSLVTILAVIAAVILLFTGKYPQDLFKLVMGFNRWSFRVYAYVALMTDEYPPFSLDYD